MQSQARKTIDLLDFPVERPFSVVGIADDWVAKMFEVAPDLMKSSRARTRFDKRQMTRLNFRDTQAYKLGVRLDPSPPLRSRHWVVDRDRFRSYAPNKRDISFSNPSVAKIICEFPSTGAIERKQEHTAGLPVESVQCMDLWQLHFVAQ